MERANLSLSQWLWWTERDSLLIAYYSDATDKFRSASAAEDGKLINILFIQRPDKFLISGESPTRDGYADTDSYNEVDLVGGNMTDIDMLNQVSQIPEQFHEAIVARAIASGYERKAETLQIAQHFHMKYEKGVKSAKSYAIRGRDGTPASVRPMEF